MSGGVLEPADSPGYASRGAAGKPSVLSVAEVMVPA
jgi:hypothetical protein